MQSHKKQRTRVSAWLGLPVIVLALMLGVSYSRAPSVHAVNGANLASFNATTTAGIPACASGIGTGLAYDVTTNSLVLSCWGSNVLERVDAVTHLNDGAVTIAGLPFGNDLKALAYDAGRNRLWACNGHTNVVLIDIGAAAVDVSVSSFAVPGCTDGLAYDGSDDTLWVSADVAATVNHYTVGGGLIGSFPLAGLLGGCTPDNPAGGNSGIAVGGAKLYLANDGCSQIYEVAKDGSASSLFATFPARLEDLECDSETFASSGVGAIWSQDAYDRNLNAWEIPSGACASGGAPAQPDIQVTKICPATVIPGDQITCTITVKNNGPAAATGVTLTDTVTGGTLVSATSTQGTCSLAGNTATCNIGNLASGASATVTVVIQTSVAPGTVSDTATGASTESDLDPSNNTSKAETRVVVPASTVGCKITDGGRFTAANGDKATFGANAQAPNKGQQEYQDHGPAVDINVHSISITAVVCSADKKSGSIFGTATINGAGTYYFRIDVQDLGEPGTSDTYRIRLSDGYDSGVQVLTGGNIQIHK